MPFQLQDTFREGPITQIPRAWYETVARAIKHLAGVNITVTKPDNITPDTPILLEVTSVEGVPGLLADGQTPLAHADTHKAGGDDSVALDELAAPSDNTALNATTGAHGLLRKLSGSAGQFLDGTGAWNSVSGTIPDGTAEGQVPVWDAGTEAWVPSEIQTLPVGTEEGQVLAWGAEEGAWTPAVLDFKAGLEGGLEGEGSGFVFFNDTTDTISTVAPNDITTGYPKYLRLRQDGTYELEDLLDDTGGSGLNGALALWRFTDHGTWQDMRLGHLSINNAAGKFLRVASGGGMMEWADVAGAGSGSAAGQMLAWDTGTDPDSWGIVAAGTTGQILAGVTGAKPAFQNVNTALGAPTATADRYKVLQVRNDAGTTLVWDYVRAHA